MLGYVAGGSYQRVADLAGQASLLLLTLLVLVGGVLAAARWIARHPQRLQAVTARQLNRPRIRAQRGRYANQLAFLTRRLRPGGALGLSLTVTVLALAGAGWAFGALLQDVLGNDETALLDRPVQAFFVAHREAWLTHLMRTITDLGSATVLIPLVTAAGLLWRWRDRTWRPLALLAASTPRWSRKVTVWAVAAGLVLLVGLSRIYLGGHWLTDVLGGFALGAAWLFALLTITRTIDGLHTDPTLTTPPGPSEVTSDSSQPNRGDPPDSLDRT
jgi:undecaprenyl-diphosphatase